MSQTEQPRGEEAATDSTEWVALSTLRVGLGIIGFTLLLFALGQVIGLNLLELLVSGLTSHLGRWLIVALLAVLLIALAVRGFDDLLR